MKIRALLGNLGNFKNWVLGKHNKPNCPMPKSNPLKVSEVAYGHFWNVMEEMKSKGLQFDTHINENRLHARLSFGERHLDIAIPAEGEALVFEILAKKRNLITQEDEAWRAWITDAGNPKSQVQATSVEGLFTALSLAHEEAQFQISTQADKERQLVFA